MGQNYSRGGTSLDSMPPLSSAADVGQAKRWVLWYHKTSSTHKDWEVRPPVELMQLHLGVLDVN